MTKRDLLEPQELFDALEAAELHAAEIREVGAQLHARVHDGGNVSLDVMSRLDQHPTHLARALHARDAAARRVEEWVSAPSSDGMAYGNVRSLLSAVTRVRSALDQRANMYVTFDEKDKIIEAGMVRTPVGPYVCVDDLLTALNGRSAGVN